MKNFELIYTFLNFIKTISKHRAIIYTIACHEIKARYVGSWAGLWWSILSPLSFMFVYWFVFSIGFRIRPDGEVPFILVFLTGLIPWSLLNETLTTSVNSIVSNPHLVKKIVFPTQILPVANLLASMITHVIMLTILFVVMLANETTFSIYNIQVLYYLGALSIFIIGLSWIVAALNVFFRDVSQVLTAILQLWFWLTPIVWFKGLIPEKFHFYLDLNPMTYIVNGYRDSFLYQIPFWENIGFASYYWSLSLVFFILGGLIFRKLKTDFPEVL